MTIDYQYVKMAMTSQKKSMILSDYINARVALATCEGVSVAQEKKGWPHRSVVEQKKPED